MKYTRISGHLGKLFLVSALALLPAAAIAGVPWQWQMSLQVDRVGESMYMPSAVAFDEESERYYVIDTGRSRLVSFGRDGEMLKAFTAENRLKSPFDMVRLDNGRLWVVEKGRNSLTRIDIGAREVKPYTLYDGGRKVFPDRIAFGWGKLHVLDRSSGQVLRLDDKLSVEQRFGCIDCAGGVADFVIAEGSLWALDRMEKKVQRFDADGNLTGTIDLDDEVDFPVSIAIGPSGFLYILDRHQNSVLAYSQDGQFRYRFLGSGQAPGNVYFARQLRFDPWGRLCVVDEGNGRVEIFSR